MNSWESSCPRVTLVSSHRSPFTLSAGRSFSLRDTQTCSTGLPLAHIPPRLAAAPRHVYSSGPVVQTQQAWPGFSGLGREPDGFMTEVLHAWLTCQLHMSEVRPD